MGPVQTDLWLTEAQCVSENGRHRIFVRSPFHKEGLEAQCAAALRTVYGDHVRVEVAKRARLAKRRLGAGPGNETAKRMVQAFMEGGPGMPNILLLHGPPGSGKSLLVDWAVSRHRKSVFSLDLLRMRRGGSRQLTPRKPFVVADDLATLAGANGAQRALCRMIDDVSARGGRFLFTLDGHPKTRPDLLTALRNRLVGGLVAELDTPGAATSGRRTGNRAADRESLLPLLLQAASETFAIDLPELTSTSRRRAVVEARRAVMLHAVDAGMRCEEVAEHLGLKAARSVRDGCQWTRRQQERDPRFARLLHEVGRVVQSR
ncbi:MAG: hypothetical protein V3T86_11825 [Planctomycetota bacterium]